MNRQDYRNLFDNFHRISIIGISKNAGKTTVLNSIIYAFQNNKIAITSIGLDGEKIDNITHLPKPRIRVFPNMILATAEKCLEECTFNYDLLETTNIRTPLGKIVIIEAKSDGFALLAGPSTKTQMASLITKIMKYDPFKIFIDGALFRKSFASSVVSDAVVLVSGASFNKDMEVVVKHTNNLVDQLNFGMTNLQLKSLLERTNNSCVIDQNSSVISISKDKYELINNMKLGCFAVYIDGAVTNKLIDYIIEKSTDVKFDKMIINDATAMLLDSKHYEYLKQIVKKVEVLNKIENLFVAYNPFSPLNYKFEQTEFFKELSKIPNVKLINVLTDLEWYHE